MFRRGDRVKRRDGKAFWNSKYEAVVFNHAQGGKVYFFDGSIGLYPEIIELISHPEEKKFKLQTEMTLVELAYLKSYLRYAAGSGEAIFKECIDIIKKNSRKTVEIGGKTYYEDELATALASIKEV